MVRSLGLNPIQRTDLTLFSSINLPNLQYTNN